MLLKLKIPRMQHKTREAPLIPLKILLSLPSLFLELGTEKLLIMQLVWLIERVTLWLVVN
jgi:hypothetical protein